IAEPKTPLAQLDWQPFTADPKNVPDGQVLFVKFPEVIQPSEIGGGFRTATSSNIEAAPAGAAVLASQAPLGEKEWSAVRFPASKSKSDVFEFKSADGKAFEAGLIRAFLDKTKPIVQYDFSKTFRQMDIIE